MILYYSFFYFIRRLRNCAWHTAVLIPKWNGDFQGIRLVEVLWKTVMGILNRCLVAAIQFHNNLHGFCTVRGTGTTSLESNMLQQFMDMREEFLYEISLYIHKAYDALYSNRFIDILEVYGVFPWYLCLLCRYWEILIMVAWAG